MKKTSSIFFLLLFFLPGVWAEESSVFPATLPFKNLSSEEILLLQKGERLFRVLDSHKDIRLKETGEASEKLISIINDVKPNFLAEIIMVIPVDGTKAPLSYVLEALTDIKKFDTIPYHSTRKDKWYPLFENTQILARTSNFQAPDLITVSHRMKPFEPHENTYEYSLEGNIFTFFGRNITPLFYKGLRTVRAGNLLNLLWIRKEGDMLIIYGAGGASAFTFFGLFGGERMDIAFIGRVEAFFSWFYDEYITEISTIKNGSL